MPLFVIKGSPVATPAPFGGTMRSFIQAGGGSPAAMEARYEGAPQVPETFYQRAVQTLGVSSAPMTGILGGSAFFSLPPWPSSGIDTTAILDSLVHGPYAAPFLGLVLILVGAATYFIYRKLESVPPPPPYRRARDYMGNFNDPDYKAEMRVYEQILARASVMIEERAPPPHEAAFAETFLESGGAVGYAARGRFLQEFLAEHDCFSDCLFDIFHEMAKAYAGLMRDHPDFPYDLYPYGHLRDLQLAPCIANDPRFAPTLDTLASLAIESVRRSAKGFPPGPWRVQRTG